MSRGVILIAVGVALIALFIALTLPPSKPAEASTTVAQITTQPTPTSPTAVQTTPTATERQDTATHAQETADGATTRTQTTTTTQTQTATQQTTTPRGVGPQLYVKFNMPATLNTTELPINITYSVVLTNSGDQDAYAYIDDEQVAVPAGKAVVINKTLTITSAGTYVIKVTAPNGTQVAHALSVFYFAPRLEAEPVKIEVKNLPAQLLVNTTIVNTGNYTAQLNDVEIRPGEKAEVKIPLNITAAGIYHVEIYGVKIPVTVVYSYAHISAEIQAMEVEALPGEEVEIPVTLRNTGNATAEVQIAGEKIKISPNASFTYRYKLRAEKAGLYPVEFSEGGKIYRREVMVKIIAINVEFRIEKPQKDVLRPGTTATMEVDGRQTQIVWRPVVYTNATSRTIVVNVDGNIFHIKPRQNVELDPRTLNVKVSETAELQVKINNTIYVASIILKPRLPTLTIKDIYRIEVRDSRDVYAVKISCSRPIQKDFRLDILDVNMHVEFGGAVTFSGVITIDGEVKGEVSLRGQAASGEGWAIFGDIYIPAIGRSITANIRFSLNPLQILEVEIPDAPYVQCTYPVELVPRYLNKVTGTYRLDTLAIELVNMLAKSTTDLVNIYSEINYDGEKITLSDNAGRKITVTPRQGYIEIQGDGLSAWIYYTST